MARAFEAAGRGQHSMANVLVSSNEKASALSVQHNLKVLANLFAVSLRKAQKAKLRLD